MSADLRARQSGGKRAAVQTLREVRWSRANAVCIWMRWLQHRFRTGCDLHWPLTSRANAATSADTKRED